MYKNSKSVNNYVYSFQNGENWMTVDDSKKKTFINKLLFVFRPKSTADIVLYAEKIIDDYTGTTVLRDRQRRRRMQRITVMTVSAISAAFISMIVYALKIFL